MKSLGRAAGRNPGIDWMKLLAAWMVIAIHTYPFQSVSGTAEILFTRTACRLAVPFFFLVTGFYVIPRCMERGEGLRRTGKWFGKTTAMYGIAILLYLPVNWYAGRLAGGISPGKNTPGGCLERNLLPSLVFSCGPDGYGAVAVSDPDSGEK